MFDFFQKEDPHLNDAIISAFADLKSHSADDDDYQKTVDQLTKLYALKPTRVDPNTVLIVAGNIFLGMQVLKYEQTGVITSKIWSFLKKI